MKKIKKFLKDFFRLTSAEELKEAVKNSDYQRVANILRWHRSLANFEFSYDTTKYEEGEAYTVIRYATVLDFVFEDPEMERLLLHFGAKTNRELEAEKNLLLQKRREKEEKLQQEAKLRRQNGKAIVDKILGTN